MYKKVLVPLDGSTVAECALNHAKNLLKDGAVGEITLLNVVELYVPSSDMYEGFDYKAIWQNAQAQATNYLADMASRLGEEGIKVKTELVEDSRPAAAIIDYARKNGMDMIVISTHGYTGLKKMLMGSVAFRVLQEANVPVLLIRPESCPVQ